MKKFIILPIFAIILCGCSQNKIVKPIISNISFTAQVVYEENEYCAKATLNNGHLNLVFSKPKEINGFILSVDKNTVKTEINGISHAVDVNSLPQSAFIRVLHNVFVDVSQKNATYSKENCEIISKVDDIKYCFTFSPSGLPISLEVENLNLKINFSNVTIN